MRAQPERNPKSTNISATQGFVSRQRIDRHLGELPVPVEEAVGDALANDAADAAVPSAGSVAVACAAPASEAASTSVSIADLPAIAADAPVRARGGSRASQVDQLLELIAPSCVDFFHTPGRSDRDAYVRHRVDDHVETARVNSTQFKHWIASRAMRLHGRVPSRRALNDAVEAIVGKALFEGPERSVAVRIAELDGDIWLDLGDSEWRAVRITVSGWHLVASENVPVSFIRPTGMGALPVPCRGGSVNELRGFVNLPDDVNWSRTLTWLVSCFRPEGPFPILAINGQQGSAKSWASRVLRSLVDPNRAPLRRPCRNTRDLMLAAQNAWVLNFDNLTSLTQEQSDDLCALATGGGFGTRALFTDDEEQLFDVARPVMINSINELATYPDLLDRSLVVSLPTILPTARLEQRVLRRAFEAARPRILGAVLDAVSAALSKHAEVQLPWLPRTADCATWATAAESALGLQDGAVLRCFATNAMDAALSSIESSPIGPALMRFADNHTKWTGTATELLRALEIVHESTGARYPAGWPRGAGALSRRLRSLAPNLLLLGLELQFPREPGGIRERQIELTKIVPAVVDAVPNPALLTARVSNEVFDTTVRNRPGQESLCRPTEPPGRPDARDANQTSVAHCGCTD